MKNWLKENWFKLGVLILVTIFVFKFLALKTQEINIKKFQAEQSAINWAIEKETKTLVGQREINSFKKYFWEFIN